MLYPGKDVNVGEGGEVYGNSLYDFCNFFSSKTISKEKFVKKTKSALLLQPSKIQTCSEPASLLGASLRI